MMIKREIIFLGGVLTLSMGLAVVWYVRDRASRTIPPPPPEILFDTPVLAATAVSAPVVHFDESFSTSEVAEAGAESPPISQTWQAEERVEESDAMQLPDLSRLTVEDIRALMEENDQEELQAVLQALIADGNASLPLLDAMLHSGTWRVERMAVMALSRIETTEARLKGISRLLTREGEQRRGWHHLAAMMGRNLNGEMVDLLAGLAEDAEGDARRRILTMMQHVRDEDGLFRLYLLGEEHPDPAVRRASINTVFRGRRAASIPLLQDIMMAHENPEVAGMAAIGLARGGRAEGIEFLAQAGNSNQPEAELAIRALEQARSPRSHRILSEVAGSPDYETEVRLAAVRALGTSARQGRARHFLAQVAEGTDVDVVRETAASFLEEQAQ